MSEDQEPQRLKRGEAPRLLEKLRGSLTHDFSLRHSQPEIAEAMHSAMTVADVRVRYGLPDALPNAKIESAFAKVTRDRAEVFPRYVLCIRMRDGKVMHVEKIIYPEFAEDHRRRQRRIAGHVEAARKALQLQIAKRRRGLQKHDGRKGAEYVAIGIEGWEPEKGGGDLLRHRGCLYGAWTTRAVSEEEAAQLVAACTPPPPKKETGERRGLQVPDFLKPPKPKPE